MKKISLVMIAVFALNANNEFDSSKSTNFTMEDLRKAVVIQDEDLRKIMVTQDVIGSLTGEDERMMNEVHPEFTGEKLTASDIARFESVNRMMTMEGEAKKIIDQLLWNYSKKQILDFYERNARTPIDMAIKNYLLGEKAINDMIEDALQERWIDQLKTIEKIMK